MTIKGSLLVSVPLLSGFRPKILSRQTGPQNGGFTRKWGSNHSILISRLQKAHPCAEPRLDVFCVKISVGASAVASLKYQKNEIIAEPEERYFTHWGEKTPGLIWSKVCTGEMSWT